MHGLIDATLIEFLIRIQRDWVFWGITRWHGEKPHSLLSPWEGREFFSVVYNRKPNGFFSDSSFSGNYREVEKN